MIDYSKCKSIPAIKNLERETLLQEISDFLASKYGDNNITRVAAGEIAVNTGDYKDEDGFLHEVCSVIKIITKSFNDNDGGVRIVESYDRYQAGQDYLFELNRKKKKG